MALTGYDDSSSEEGAPNDAVEMTDVDQNGDVVDQNTDGGAGGESNLTESNLEEHNKNTSEQCTHRGNEDGGIVTNKVGAASLVFGLSGMFLGGPILGLLSGVGAYAVASNDDGPAGDAARATGDFAITTGSKVGEAARDANEKHGILEKILNAFTAGWNRVQKFDEEHKIGEKAKETMSDVQHKAVEFEQKHHVAENILQGIQRGVSFLLDKLRETTSPGESSTRTQH